MHIFHFLPLARLDVRRIVNQYQDQCCISSVDQESFLNKDHVCWNNLLHVFWDFTTSTNTGGSTEYLREK